LAKLFLEEAESAEVKRFLAAESALASAQIVGVELTRALRRAEAPPGVMEQARTALGRIHLRQLSNEILARAADVTPRSLRALDAIHLATALDFSPPPDLFLCYDRRLAAAARSHGLAVLAPGADEVHEP
jgi:predicted nucleic acid-binding protein